MAEVLAYGYGLRKHRSLAAGMRSPRRPTESRSIQAPAQPVPTKSGKQLIIVNNTKNRRSS